MRENQSSNFERSLFMLFVVGGVAGVLWVLFAFVAPPLLDAPSLPGKTELALREEAASVLPGNDASACSYSAKHLILACPVSPNFGQETMAKLRVRGWVGESGATVLRRGREVAWTECEKARPGQCLLNLRYTLNS